MNLYTGQAAKRRALPLDQTVRWLPLHDAYYLLAEVMTSTRAVPLVVMQEALLQVEAHASSEVYGSTCGILCGDQYRDSKSGVSYLLVEGIERAARMDRDGDPDASLARWSAGIASMSHYLTTSPLPMRASIARSSPSPGRSRSCETAPRARGAAPSSAWSRTKGAPSRFPSSS